MSEQIQDRVEDPNTQIRETITLAEFADLTGFPVSLIKTELLLNSDLNDDSEVEVSEIRERMANYLNSEWFK